jgi:hypothetical protein
MLCDVQNAEYHTNISALMQLPLTIPVFCKALAAFNSGTNGFITKEVTP